MKKLKVVIIDGQGGRLGQLVAEETKKVGLNVLLYGIGTNTVATSAMLKGGADFGATGENPVLVACRDADVIIGPVGIVCADSMLGEITPDMAVAIGQSKAKKLLIPVNQCNNTVVGVKPLSMSDAVGEAVKLLTAAVSDYE